MQTIIRFIRYAFAAFLLASGSVLFNGCVEPEPRGPYYDYNYYPAQNIYYYPAGRVYYWNDNGYWRSGPELPPTIVVRGGQYEPYRSRSTEPWTEREAKPGQIQQEHGSGYYYQH